MAFFLLTSVVQENIFNPFHVGRNISVAPSHLMKMFNFIHKATLTVFAESGSYTPTRRPRKVEYPSEGIACVYARSKELGACLAAAMSEEARRTLSLEHVALLHRTSDAHGAPRLQPFRPPASLRRARCGILHGWLLRRQPLCRETDARGRNGPCCCRAFAVRHARTRAPVAAALCGPRAHRKVCHRAGG